MNRQMESDFTDDRQEFPFGSLPFDMKNCILGECLNIKVPDPMARLNMWFSLLLVCQEWKDILLEYHNLPLKYNIQIANRCRRRKVLIPKWIFEMPKFLVPTEHIKKTLSTWISLCQHHPGKKRDLLKNIIITFEERMTKEQKEVIGIYSNTFFERMAPFLFSEHVDEVFRKRIVMGIPNHHMKIFMKNFEMTSHSVGYLVFTLDFITHHPTWDHTPYLEKITKVVLNNLHFFSFEEKGISIIKSFDYDAISVLEWLQRLDNVFLWGAFASEKKIEPLMEKLNPLVISRSQSCEYLLQHFYKNKGDRRELTEYIWLFRSDEEITRMANRKLISFPTALDLYFIELKTASTKTPFEFGGYKIEWLLRLGTVQERQQIFCMVMDDNEFKERWAKAIVKLSGTKETVVNFYTIWHSHKYLNEKPSLVNKK